jgi:hypothetical protein
MDNVVGSTLKPFGLFPGVSQVTLWELEAGFSELELHGCTKMDELLFLSQCLCEKD